MRIISPDCPLFNSAKGAVFNTAGKVRPYILAMLILDQLMMT
jgi:hypothetical protein